MKNISIKLFVQFYFCRELFIVCEKTLDKYFYKEFLKNEATIVKNEEYDRINNFR